MYRFKQLILLGGDLVCCLFSLWLALTGRYLELPAAADFIVHAWLFGGLFFLWTVVNFITGLYDLSALRGATQYRRLAEAGAISFGLSILILYLLPPALTPKTILLLTTVIAYALCGLWRLVFTTYIARSKLHTRVIMLGFDAEAEELVGILDRYPERGYKVVAVLDPDKKMPSEHASATIYRSLQALRPAISTHRANLIVTAPYLKNNEETIRELYELLFWPVKITDVPSFYELVTGRVPPTTFSEAWFLSNIATVDDPLYQKLRRALDYLAGAAMGAILIVLFPLIALGTKLSSRGPVFFSQRRVGRYGALFTLHKFRTMYALSADGSAEQGEAQFAQKDDKRITPFGKLLRKTRLDELPQAWNLLAGDITLIGPRPERPEIVAKLEARMPYYPLRHVVKPGITGWAAIHQHYTDTLDTTLQKLQYDLYYIKNRSVVLDLSILLRTVNVVLRMMGQ